MKIGRRYNIKDINVLIIDHRTQDGVLDLKSDEVILSEYSSPSSFERTFIVGKIKDEK